MKDKNKQKSMTEEGVFMQIRMRKKLKDDACSLFNSMGVSASDVIRLMLTKAVKDGEIPFDF